MAKPLATTGAGPKNPGLRRYRRIPRQGWTVTNYAHYLATHPPTWEAELKPVTAWSCSHGVDRWQDDCGCGGGGDWHQQWRRPLRDALDWLRDQLGGL
jgi:alpha-amylase/alpha-mannosidase (GH57 family)